MSQVGLSVGPNRGVSTLLTPAPTFNAGYAVAYVFCLVYALFQARGSTLTCWRFAAWQAIPLDGPSPARRTLKRRRRLSLQALPAEAPRPLLRRIGWLSGLMFASQSTVALLARHATPLSRLWGGSPWLVRICRRSLIRRCAFSPQSSMLTLSSGSLQHFADFRCGLCSGRISCQSSLVSSLLPLSLPLRLIRLSFFSCRPDILISHVGGAAPINWAMIFVSIAALLPSGLLMQALMAPQNRHWAFEDHILIAAPLSIWSAWCVRVAGRLYGRLPSLCL